MRLWHFEDATQVVASAAAREAALGEAQAALQRRSAELEAEHGWRMAKADAAIKRLQVRQTSQTTYICIPHL